MPDPQKSEVRPDAPEQKQPDTFCRDCADYAYMNGGVCRLTGNHIDPDAVAPGCFVRRPA